MVDGPELDATSVAVGGTLGFSCVVENTGATPKVFKLTTKTLGPGERLTVARTHSFKVITTRVHHAGEHAIALQVNGRAFGRSVFTLLP